MNLFSYWWAKRSSFRKALHEGQWRDEQGELTVDGRRVLADLRGFCRANETCVVFDKEGRYDTHATAVAEGRREVLLRIQHTLGLTDEALMRLRDPDEEPS